VTPPADLIGAAVPETFFVNLNFVCNERCVFCAAGLSSGGWTVSGRGGGVTLDDVRKWTSERPPGPSDRVAIAGGEPTLHRELVPIVRYLASGGAPVTIFTNGLRLANTDFARAVLGAGTARIEIALFGAQASTHDAVTQRTGSFQTTLAALRVLSTLHAEFSFIVEVRLLVARQCIDENPLIVRLLAEQVPGVDVVSINRLILSADADKVDAAVSWEEARASINQTARAVLDAGYDLQFDAVPLCVYDNDVAVSVQARAAESRARGPRAHAQLPMRYLDPRSVVGYPVVDGRAQVALPRTCRCCDLLPVCGRVERWYVDRFGVAGLRPVRMRPNSLGRR
jgi:MoaA/NifB/PqqE/SkfB family radical SAM enzyme